MQPYIGPSKIYPIKKKYYFNLKLWSNPNIEVTWYCFSISKMCYQVSEKKFIKETIRRIRRIWKKGLQTADSIEKQLEELERRVSKQQKALDRTENKHTKRERERERTNDPETKHIYLWEINNYWKNMSYTILWFK